MNKTINVETKYGIIPLSGDLIENEDGTYTYKLNVDWESINLEEMAAKYIGLTD